MMTDFGESDKKSVSLLEEAGSTIRHAFDRARAPESSRMLRFVEAAAEGAGQIDPKSREYVMAARPCLDATMRIMSVIVAIYIALYTLLYKLYLRLPTNAIAMVFGCALCFFGGTYFASVAAIEAFRLFGWESLTANLAVVAEQAHLVAKASDEDDKLDEDADGVADVDALATRELLNRKTLLAMTTIKEPERLLEAWSQLWTAYVAVLATLHLEFARTTALALAIVEMVKFPILRLLLQPLMEALGPATKHWGKTIIEVRDRTTPAPSPAHTRGRKLVATTFAAFQWAEQAAWARRLVSGTPHPARRHSPPVPAPRLQVTLNIIAILLAWYFQAVISGFYSAIRGGKLFAEGFFALLVQFGLIQRLPCFKDGFDPDQSYMDELIGYSLAASGFLFQLTRGFVLPFPFDLLLFPLTLVEYFLRWQLYLTT